MEDSLNASTRLLERLNHDRLPSPTRSAILAPGDNTGRQSLGGDSEATEALLDARPTDFTASYSQTPQSHASNALLESLDLKYGPTSAHRTGDASFSTLKGPYHLKGVDDLMSSMQTVNKGLGLKSYSSESLTVDDLVASARNDRCKLASWVSASPQKDHSTLRNHGVTSTNNDLLSGHLNDIQRKWDRRYPLTSTRKPSAKNITQPKDVATRGRISKSDARRSTKSAAPLVGHSRARDVNTDVNTMTSADRSVTSGATESSIVSGHLLRSKQQRGAAKKVASTPVRGGGVRSAPNSKQLRFHVDSAAVLGHSLDSRNTSATHSKSLDLSNIEPLPGDKPDMSFGRREIVSILKPPPSPAKVRPTSSRVSFTTDDLIHADASGLDATPSDHRRRSRSLPRPGSRHHDESTSHLSRSSPGNSRGQRTENSTLRAAQSERKHTSDRRAPSPLRARSLARDLSTSSRDMDEARQTQYKQFLAALMRDIEDSTSSVVTSASVGTATADDVTTPGDVTPTPSAAAARSQAAEGTVWMSVTNSSICWQ